MNTNKGQNAEKEKRTCPYCEGQILEAGYPYCKPCGVTLRFCGRCQIVVEREATVCPRCGGELEWK